MKGREGKRCVGQRSELTYFTPIAMSDINSRRKKRSSSRAQSRNIRRRSSNSRSKSKRKYSVTSKSESIRRLRIRGADEEQNIIEIARAEDLPPIPERKKVGSITFEEAGTVDLTGFENLRTLKVWDYRGERNLDLGMCPNLRELSIVNLHTTVNPNFRIEGLEACTRLEHLKIVMNEMTLDSDLSNLPYLRTFYFRGAKAKLSFGTQISLEEITIHAQFNESLDLRRIPKLQRLVLDSIGEYDQYLNLSESRELRSLKILSTSFRSVLNFDACVNVREIELDHYGESLFLYACSKLHALTVRNFNRQIFTYGMTELAYLRLEGEFNQYLQISDFPNLETLVLGDRFNRNLFLNDDLKVLIIGNAFSKELDVSNCRNLEALLLGDSFNHNLNLRENGKLEELQIGAGFTRALDLSQNNQLTHIEISLESFEKSLLPEHLSSDERRGDLREYLEEKQRRKEIETEKKTRIGRLVPRDLGAWRETNGFDPAAYVEDRQLECFDFLALEGVEARGHVTGRDNIVIGVLDAGTRTLKQAVCSTVAELRRAVADDDTRFSPCLEPDRMGEGILRDVVAVKFSLEGLNCFVPEADVLAAIESGARAFGLVKDESLTWPAAISAQAVARQDYVSADHCQAGSGKALHRMLPLALKRRNPARRARDAPRASEAPERKRRRREE